MKNPNTLLNTRLEYSLYSSDVNTYLNVTWSAVGVTSKASTVASNVGKAGVSVCRSGSPGVRKLVLVASERLGPTASENDPVSDADDRQRAGKAAGRRRIAGEGDIGNADAGSDEIVREILGRHGLAKRCHHDSGRLREHQPPGVPLHADREEQST